MGFADALPILRTIKKQMAKTLIKAAFFRASYAGSLDCFGARAPKKRQRFKALISLELSSDRSPHPEERALLSARLEGWPRGPWFETPRKSAAPHHEVPVWLARFIQPGRPKVGAELAMTGARFFVVFSPSLRAERPRPPKLEERRRKQSRSHENKRSFHSCGSVQRVRPLAGPMTGSGRSQTRD
jgi:hypothetical protein